MATYIHGHHESVLRSHSWRTASNSAAYLLPHVTAGIHVLDVGCGPGTITVDLGDRVGTEGSVLGIDIAAEVVEIARDAKPARSANVDYVVGDIFTADLAERSYDVVHAHQVLQHLQDPVAALERMRRLVRPGGIVAVRDADYSAMTWYPEDERLDSWLTLYDRLARHNGGEPNAGRRLLHWGRQAGFTDVTASASVWCFATPEDRHWWGGLQADRTLHSTFAEQAKAAGLAQQATLETIADGWRDWEAFDYSWFVVVHGEIIARS